MFDNLVPDSEPDFKNIPPSAPPFVLDNFKTEYHPRARHDLLIQCFEEFSHSRPAPDFSKVNPEPWWPFSSRIDFEFAEFALDAALNRRQVSALLNLVDCVTANRTQLTFRTYDDVMHAWSAASHKQPAVRTFSCVPS